MANAPSDHQDVPSVASKSTFTRVGDRYAELTFALPTSLAFAKRLTWNQTPWVNQEFHGTTITRIERRDAKVISYQLTGRIGKPVSIATIENALFLGTIYTKLPLDQNVVVTPQLFAVFPQTTRTISQDATFLKVWNDDIVKPAFDQAWKESGLVHLHGASKDFGGILPSHGIRHEKEAHTSAVILSYLARNAATPLQTNWPEFAYDDAVAMGKRAVVFDEAWTSIAGMLDGHPQLAEFQAPFLLAVSRHEAEFDPAASAQELYAAAARTWDACIDARYVEPGSFSVAMTSVIGVHDVAAEDARVWAEKEEEERKKGKGGVRGGIDCNFYDHGGKRVAVDDPDPTVGSHRDKHARLA